MLFDEKLRALLKKRILHPEQLTEIDSEIIKSYTKVLTILKTDLADFSKTTKEYGVIHTLALLELKNILIEPIMQHYKGRLLKDEGDSLFIAFESPDDALATAINFKNAISNHNQSAENNYKFNVCQGLATGEVIDVGKNAFGDAVNIASKLGEDLADGSQIFVCENVHKYCQALPGINFIEHHAEISDITLHYYEVT
ncbi:MAG: adenylate/guanylate cyclase domain-containing protein [Gammaproteobacteria bacterium]|nr:adenylate/guanylate cyclase domain-containing protein [Gammaproteobacteria bacterium]